MKKALFVAGIVAMVALIVHQDESKADGIMVAPRSHRSFRLNTATDNIPASPSILSTSLILSAVGNAQHMTLCSEATSRIRVNWRKGTEDSAPASGEYNAIVPAAASGSFTCMTLDDVQMSRAVYIWSDSGSAISSGLVYGYTW
jgi:hypothetical protein